ncbi:MAG: type II toxin-antitoxin system Phd/YefM family antitoxin [Treponema sp.]|nr:type II toxin-antitoxin system Phd/YefM family antitoxin [Spirochaetia bacterium]MEE1182067.1 type II toxin-antitoxin system Phd/YefM family antitoxin [Treponema sp.]
MAMTITANDLKIKGVSYLESVVNENDGAIITVRGKEKYIVLKVSDYNRIREIELENAILESKKDIENGKIHTDGVSAHIKRICDV